MPPLTPDQIIKNLLRDYPVEALEFFNEDVIKKYGYPVKINFNIQEIKKNSHFDFDLTPALPRPHSTLFTTSCCASKHTHPVCSPLRARALNHKTSGFILTF